MEPSGSPGLLAAVSPIFAILSPSPESFPGECPDRAQPAEELRPLIPTRSQLQSTILLGPPDASACQAVCVLTVHSAGGWALPRLWALGTCDVMVQANCPSSTHDGMLNVSAALQTQKKPFDRQARPSRATSGQFRPQSSGPSMLS